MVRLSIEMQCPHNRTVSSRAARLCRGMFR